jgi:hypothetical protein
LFITTTGRLDPITLTYVEESRVGNTIFLVVLFWYSIPKFRALFCLASYTSARPYISDTIFLIVPFRYSIPKFHALFYLASYTSARLRVGVTIFLVVLF